MLAKTLYHICGFHNIYLLRLLFAYLIETSIYLNFSSSSTAYNLQDGPWPQGLRFVRSHKNCQQQRDIKAPVMYLSWAFYLSIRLEKLESRTIQKYDRICCKCLSTAGPLSWTNSTCTPAIGDYTNLSAPADFKSVFTVLRQRKIIAWQLPDLAFLQLRL